MAKNPSIGLIKNAPMSTLTTMARIIISFLFASIIQVLSLFLSNVELTSRETVGLE
jgi:hypothetical protein